LTCSVTSASARTSNSVVLAHGARTPEGERGATHTRGFAGPRGWAAAEPITFPCV
jgi:hypothetical protein